MAGAASSYGHAHTHLRCDHFNKRWCVCGEAVTIVAMMVMSVPFTVVVALVGVALVMKLREGDRTNNSL